MSRARAAPFLLAAIGALAALAAAVLLLADRPSRGAPARVVLILSGELRGRLEPCGCSKDLLGGLPRRAGYLARLRAEGAAVLPIDAGALVEGADRRAELKLETALDLYEAMGYVALALARPEGLFGVDRVAALARDRGIAPLAPGEIAAVEAAPGPRVALLALADGPEADPAEALRARAGELAAAGAFRVVLFDGSVERAHALAEAAPGAADLVVAGDGEDFPRYEGARAGGALIATYGALGKALGRVDVTAPGRGERPRAAFTWVPLDAAVPEDPEALRALELRQERLRAERLLETLPRTPDPLGAPLGSRACAACHAAAYDAWAGSRHASALETLERAGRDADPDCVVCHVVGLERRGGFVSRERTPDLAGVGCESCHGAGGPHLADPRAPMPAAGEASCARCHNAEHHPDFDFARAWPLVEHR